MGYSEQHLYFDDIQIGQEWKSAERVISEQDILAFANLSGDFNPMHVDHQYAQKTPFGKIIAHGYGVLGMMSGLSVSLPPMRTIALLHIRNWKFQNPVFVGDSLHVKTVITGKELKVNNKRGEIVWLRSIVNQDGKTVQGGEVVTLVECRPKAK